MSTTTETAENSPGVQVVLAINNRIDSDASSWIQTRCKYQVNRYPPDFLRRLDTHWPENYWFGYTFSSEIMPLVAKGLEATITSPFRVGGKGEIIAASCIVDTLTCLNALEHWSAYPDCPNLDKDEVAFKFMYNGYVLGFKGHIEIKDVLFAHGSDAAGHMYDPCEKGKVLLDYPVTMEQLQTIPGVMQTHLTLICTRDADKKLIAKELVVGDPVPASAYIRPVTNEICHARTVSLKEARMLGYTHVQLSDVDWNTELRKDPS